MERDLMSRFWKSIQLPGSSLFIDSDEARWTFYEHLATLPVSYIQKLGEWEVLKMPGPPGMPQRYREWREFMHDTHYL